MPKAKKPPVEARLRRDWFRRHEEDGESVPQITKADGYDVRTVRKQIEKEREERERKEARSLVLRKAVEDHYRDVCVFAEKLDAEVAREEGTIASMRADYMWLALREHMPRSKIWRNLDRWERLKKELREHRRETANAFRTLISTNVASMAQSASEAGLTDGLTMALVAESRFLAEGEWGLLKRAGFRSVENNDGTTTIELGDYNIGRVLHDEVENTKELVGMLLGEVTYQREHYEMQRLVTEWKRVQRVLQDELAIIILRRIVPGRCRYCPV